MVETHGRVARHSGDFCDNVVRGGVGCHVRSGHERNNRHRQGWCRGRSCNQQRERRIQWHNWSAQSDPTAFEAGLILSAFVIWAVAATVLYYRWYGSLIALLRSPIPLAEVFAQIVGGVVEGAKLHHTGNDPTKKRSKLLESFGKQLAAKVFGLNLAFLVSHAVAVVGRPHPALIPNAARVEILIRVSMESGLRCAINEHLARLVQSPSGQTQATGLTLPSEIDQPAIFQAVVFVVADELHNAAYSMGNPNAGRLPESAAVTSRRFAELTAAAIHDSEIVSSIFDEFEITTARSQVTSNPQSTEEMRVAEW